MKSDQGDRIALDNVYLVRRGKRGRWTAEFSLHGRHCRRSLRTGNLKIARERAAKLARDLAAGEYRAAPAAVTIADAVRRYLAFKSDEHRKPKTLVKYTTELHRFESFSRDRGVRMLNQVSAGLHDRYREMQNKELDRYTVYNLAVILKGFLKWCVSRDLIARNPLDAVRLAKPVRIPKFAPSLQDIDKLLGAADQTLASMIAVLAFTGMRSGELQMLRDEDVDVAGGWIHIISRDEWSTKTGLSRKLPIHPRLVAYLRQQVPTKRDYFFTAAPSKKYPNGNHCINTKHLNERVRRLAARLGMSVGRADDGLVVHSLRHFFETHCVNAGIPQRVIDTWLGHRGDRSMASVYYRLSDAESQSFMLKVPFGVAELSATMAQSDAGAKGHAT